MVHPRYTSLANTAMLAPCRFQKLAGFAYIARIIQHSVIWVVTHMLGVIVLVYVRLIIFLCAQIQKGVRLRQQENNKQLVVHSKQMPHGRQEEQGACCDEAEEEDDDKRVLVMHQVVAQAGATVGDTAIGEFEIEFTKRGWKVHDEEAVEEAYGRVSDWSAW